MLLGIVISIKVVASLIFTVAIMAAVGVLLRRGWSWPGLLRAAGLTALALIVLVRGAPHNNPLIYAVFDRFGSAGLIVVTFFVLGAGVAIGWCLAHGRAIERIRHQVEGAWLGHAVMVLASIAAVSALESVLRFWDLPAWGDAVFWDRIAHLIARGEMPAGHSYYMPLYQYGSAFLYWTFGHYFFVPQVVNVLLAPFTVIFLCLAARAIPLNAWGVMLVGLLAASHDYLRYTPHVMQIENWYIPAVSLCLWAAFRWQNFPKQTSAIMLGVVAGIAFSIRAQGMFFLLFLLLAPVLLVSHATIGRRTIACMVALFSFLAIASPWAVRNYVVEGRFAFTGTQGPENMAFATDSRTFFGIRRDLGSTEVSAEWRQRYPNQAERELAMSRHVVTHLFTQPLYTMQGAWWRSLSFYGLLPDGVFAQGAVMPTDWTTSGKTWLMRNLATLCVLFAAGLGLLLRRDRVGLLLLGGILGSMVPVLVVGFTEARIHYPVLPLLFLAAVGGLCGAARRAAGSDDAVSAAAPYFDRGTIYRVGFLGFAAVVAAAVAWHGDLYRPLKESGILVGDLPSQRAPAPDMTQVLLDSKQHAPDRHAPPDLPLGPIKLRVAISNHHLPVKWFTDKLRGFPSFALDPAQPVYFRGHVVGADGSYGWGVSPVVAVRLHGAQFDRQPIEDDIVEIEGQVRYLSEIGLAFIDAQFGSVKGRSVNLRQYVQGEGGE